MKRLQKLINLFIITLFLSIISNPSFSYASTRFSIKDSSGYTLGTNGISSNPSEISSKTLYQENTFLMNNRIPFVSSNGTTYSFSSPSTYNNSTYTYSYTLTSNLFTSPKVFRTGTKTINVSAYGTYGDNNLITQNSILYVDSLNKIIYVWGKRTTGAYGNFPPYAQYYQYYIYKITESGSSILWQSSTSAANNLTIPSSNVPQSVFMDNLTNNLYIFQDGIAKVFDSSGTVIVTNFNVALNPDGTKKVLFTPNYVIYNNFADSDRLYMIPRNTPVRTRGVPIRFPLNSFLESSTLIDVDWNYDAYVRNDTIDSFTTTNNLYKIPFSTILNGGGASEDAITLIFSSFPKIDIKIFDSANHNFLYYGGTPASIRRGLYEFSSTYLKSFSFNPYSNGSKLYTEMDYSFPNPSDFYDMNTYSYILQNSNIKFYIGKNNVYREIDINSLTGKDEINLVSLGILTPAESVTNSNFTIQYKIEISGVADINVYTPKVNSITFSTSIIGLFQGIELYNDNSYKEAKNVINSSYSSNDKDRYLYGTGGVFPSGDYKYIETTSLGTLFQELWNNGFATTVVQNIYSRKIGKGAITVKIPK